MKSTLIVAITIAALVGPRPAEAASGIAVTSDVEGDRIERPLAAGEIVPVTFFVSSEDGDLVLGLEFALACKGEEIRIHAVEFNPAFPFSLPPQEPALPASHFRTIRLQSPADPDESFAEPGVPVWFATAELEMLQATPFESAVSFCARGVVVGTDLGEGVLQHLEGHALAAEPLDRVGAGHKSSGVRSTTIPHRADSVHACSNGGMESYPIYEAGFVKPPVQDCLGEVSARFPHRRRRSTCPSQASPGRGGSHPLPHIPEPEAEGDSRHGGRPRRYIERRPTGRDSLNHLFGIARLTERRQEENIRRTPPFKLTPVDDGITDRASLGVVLGVVTSTGFWLDRPLGYLQGQRGHAGARRRPGYTMAGWQRRPLCNMATITHNNRRATATMARFPPR